MSDLRRVRTARLVLSVPNLEADLAEMHAMLSDESRSAHSPERQHARLEETRRFLERQLGSWEADGHGSWTARRIGSGELIGFGGAKRQPTRAWNIGYGLVRAHRGQGFASELATAALAAAARIDPDVPAIAWIRPQNAPSIAVAERVGLSDRGLRIDPGDGAERHAYADRALSDYYGVVVTSQKNLK